MLRTLHEEHLLEHAASLGEQIAREVMALGHPLITGVRGAGLLRGIELAAPIGPRVVTAALEQGFIINATGPTTLRLAPPLIITAEQLATFTAALPALLDAATEGGH